MSSLPHTDVHTHPPCPYPCPCPCPCLPFLVPVLYSHAPSMPNTVSITPSFSLLSYPMVPPFLPPFIFMFRLSFSLYSLLYLLLIPSFILLLSTLLISSILPNTHVFPALLLPVTPPYTLPCLVVAQSLSLQQPLVVASVTHSPSLLSHIFYTLFLYCPPAVVAALS